MFANIYDCPNCGETWHVGIYKEIDTENDEVYEIPYCTQCNSMNLKQKFTDRGIPIVHVLTKEEMDDELYRDNNEGAV